MGKIVDGIIALRFPAVFSQGSFVEDDAGCYLCPLGVQSLDGVFLAGEEDEKFFQLRCFTCMMISQLLCKTTIVLSLT